MFRFRGSMFGPRRPNRPLEPSPRTAGGGGTRTRVATVLTSRRAEFTGSCGEPGAFTRRCGGCAGRSAAPGCSNHPGVITQGRHPEGGTHPARRTPRDGGGTEGSERRCGYCWCPTCIWTPRSAGPGPHSATSCVPTCARRSTGSRRSPAIPGSTRSCAGATCSTRPGPPRTPSPTCGRRSRSWTLPCTWPRGTTTGAARRARTARSTGRPTCMSSPTPSSPR